MRHIPTRTNRYGDGLESDTLHVRSLVGTRFDLCTLGIVPEGRSGRQVHQGPLVPGPWGYATAHALVIDNHGGSATEREQATPVEAGEPLTIEGLPGTWMLRSPDRRRLEGDGPRLAPYDGAYQIEAWVERDDELLDAPDEEATNAHAAGYAARHGRLILCETVDGSREWELHATEAEARVAWQAYVEEYNDGHPGDDIDDDEIHPGDYEPCHECHDSGMVIEPGIGGGYAPCPRGGLSCGDVADEESAFQSEAREALEAADAVVAEVTEPEPRWAPRAELYRDAFGHELWRIRDADDRVLHSGIASDHDMASILKEYRVDAEREEQERAEPARRGWTTPNTRLRQAVLAARAAVDESDRLHLEAASQKVRELYPDAVRWSRTFEGHDDEPGGLWYVSSIVDEQGRELRDIAADDPYEETEPIDQLLHQLWQDEGDGIVVEVRCR